MLGNDLWRIAIRRYRLASQIRLRGVTHSSPIRTNVVVALCAARLMTHREGHMKKIQDAHETAAEHHENAAKQVDM